eukprot:1688142-Rhodomonas_salina.2
MITSLLAAARRAMSAPHTAYDDVRCQHRRSTAPARRALTISSPHVNPCQKPRADTRHVCAKTGRDSACLGQKNTGQDRTQGASSDLARREACWSPSSVPT